MFNKLISAILLSILLFSSAFAASGGSTNTMKIDPKNFIIKTAEDVTFEKAEKIVEFESFSLRGLSSEKSLLKTSAERGKLRGQIKLYKEAGKYSKDSIIPVRVVLNFDADVEEKFEKEFERLFGNTLKYEKTKQKYYDVHVTIEQLDILVGLDEVLFITVPSDEDVVVKDDFEPSSDFTIQMNAASEMLGVKKARNDFGVITH